MFEKSLVNKNRREYKKELSCANKTDAYKELMFFNAVYRMGEFRVYMELLCDVSPELRDFISRNSLKGC